MSLPAGDVSLQEVMGWVQEQGEYLSAPGTTLVLWYLCVNAFRTDRNPEGREPGDVLSGRTAVYKIAMATGLSDRSVRRALEDLQMMGYVYADLKPGNGRSRITIYWTEAADERRAQFRAGVRDLPEGFKKVPKEQPRVVREGNVIEFPRRSSN